MASRGKKKTTFAKIAREQKLRERRIDKEARKDARRRAAEFDPAPSEPMVSEGEQQHQPVSG